MPPTTLQDIQAQITSMRRWVEGELGFDQISECELKVSAGGKFSLNIVAGDKFQKKRDYHERIGRLQIWEPGENLDVIFDQVWKSLTLHMRRDERELRFGLAQLGDTLEGEQFQTEIGRMIYERMKAVRDEISARFLPKFEPGREATEEELREPAPPSHPVVGDDEIPF